MASRGGWTPYDGLEVTGCPQGTILRGEKIMWDGAITGRARGRPIAFAEAIQPQ